MSSVLVYLNYCWVFTDLHQFSQLITIWKCNYWLWISHSKLFLCILNKANVITDYIKLRTLKTCRQVNCLQIWSDVFDFWLFLLLQRQWFRRVTHIFYIYSILRHSIITCTHIFVCIYDTIILGKWTCAWEDGIWKTCYLKSWVFPGHLHLNNK